MADAGLSGCKHPFDPGDADGVEQVLDQRCGSFRAYPFPHASLPSV